MYLLFRVALMSRAALNVHARKAATTYLMYEHT